MELVWTVPSQVREMDASRVEDHGGQIYHVAARQGREGDVRQALPSLGVHFYDVGIRPPLHRADLGAWTPPLKIRITTLRVN